MDPNELVAVVDQLEREVTRAKAARYVNADCVLTPEARQIIPDVRAATFVNPTRLEFVHGPARNFSETRLGECRALEKAWYRFRSIVEDWASDADFQRVVELGRELQTKIFGGDDTER